MALFKSNTNNKFLIDKAGIVVGMKIIENRNMHRNHKNTDRKTFSPAILSNFTPHA